MWARSPTSGELLRQYRLLAGLTQAELAHRSGYSTDYVSKLERGQRLPPAEMLSRVTDVLGLGERERRELLGARERVSDRRPGLAALAGRECELAEIGRQLVGLGPLVLLLSGEPGIGKTRLLEEAVELAVRCGWRVVRGGCHRRARDPYAPLTDAIADSLRELSDVEREAAMREAGGLHLLLPELVGEDEEPLSHATKSVSLARAPGPERGRRVMFAAVARYVEIMAGEAGTLLVLDDLQWAGQDALDLLAALAVGEGARAGRVRVVGAYRDTDPAQSAVSDFVAELARASAGHVVALGPLGEADAEGLVREVLAGGIGSGWLVSEILGRAGGVPLFLVSYAQELGRGGCAGNELDLPWTVAQVVRQRAGELAPLARELLEVAAVAGGVVPGDVLAAAANHAQERVIEAIEAACHARLLTCEGSGYRFVHELVREVIEHDLSVGRRVFWHARIGRALANLPERKRRGRAGEIAWHLHEGDDLEAALAWRVRAGDEATEASLYGQAERHYGSAVELARELEDRAGEREAAERLGDVLYRLGRRGGGTRAVRAGVRHLRTARPAGSLADDGSALL